MKTPAIAVHPIVPSAVRPCWTSSVAMAGASPRWLPTAAEDEDGVGDEEEAEDRGEHAHRLLHAPQVQHHEQDDGRPLGGHLPGARDAGGRKLQMASPPAAIDTEMVST